MNRKMKDSGIEWIGQIPEDWEVNLLKRFCHSIQTGSTPSTSKDEYFNSADVNWYTPSDFSDNSIHLGSSNRKISKLAVEEDACSYFPKGTVLFVGIGATLGKVGITETKCSANQQVNALLFNNRTCPRYGAYYLAAIKDYLKAIANASTLAILNQSSTKNIPFLNPPLHEQQQIAEFLDSKCGEVDEMVALQEKMVEELKAYKQSIISEAVTKGLNPNAPTKDSGIEWIGQIPEDWEVKQISSLFCERNEKVSDKDYSPLSVTKQGVVPQLDTVAKTGNGDSRKLVISGDFVINSRSDRKGSCGISHLDGSVSLINIVLKPKGDIDKGFFHYLSKSTSFSDEFYCLGHGIVADLWTTHYNEMKNMAIPFPPLQEQQQIADYLDKKCSEIDELISLKQQKIEALKEYKKSIISEYTTGKKSIA